MLRRIAQFATVLGAVATVGAIGAGCLDRPVTASGATTKTNFTASVTQNAIDKVDILFDIDNSASMGDKQNFLAKAVPDLISRLVTPNCTSTNAMTGVVTIVGQSSNGMCPGGSQIEFPPVHNMHIGVISSSLGTRGVTSSGAVCVPSSQTQGFPPPNGPISAHDDDRAELLNRTAANAYTEGKSADAGGQNFLDWFPSVSANVGKTATNGVTQATAPTATAIGDATTLETDFAALIIGSHYYGCGIESQLESWYRFLIQPDPYDSIAIVNVGPTGHQQALASWSGVDSTIIKQRHDFLRPDSLVAIIDLTDENDSEIDVRSFGAQGYQFMDQNFQPPRGTSICETDPANVKCTSCAYGSDPSDVNCKSTMSGGLGPYTVSDDPGYYINVRHVHMMQKYGIVPQFPLGRYVLGLTSKRVPDRFHEYPGPQPGASPSYQGGTVFDTTKSPAVPKDAGNLSCANPLFAAKLPDGSDLSVNGLCNASDPGSTRTADLVFYAHIGGVPHQLLQVDPTNLDSPQKDALLPSDWVKILGQGWGSLPSPAYAPNSNEYNYNNIDPHMVEAFEPRANLVALTTGPNPTGGGMDPINGGEWVTDGLAGSTPLHQLPVDREYACIFPLVDPVMGTAQPRDCSATNTDYSVQEACDCNLQPNIPLNAVPSVCGTKTGAPSNNGGDFTEQYYAKTYPTIREIQLVELMGAQGILSSLCPIHVTDMTAGGNDPLFGYRPAITAIVNRLKNALATQCLPEQLTPTGTNGNNQEVPCLIFATLQPTPANAIGNEAKVCPTFEGLSAPTGDQLTLVKEFQAGQKAEAAANHTPDLSTTATCIVNQIPYQKKGTCATGSEKGWCYVTDQNFTGTCSQAIQFATGVPPGGSVVSLQCIEQAPTIVGGGGMDAGDN